MDTLEKFEIGEYLIIPPDMHSENNPERFLRIYKEKEDFDFSTSLDQQSPKINCSTLNWDVKIKGFSEK